MKIEQIKVHNFKSFQNFEMSNIPQFCVVTGANGTGKSTFFDIFGFLKDCLTYNVRKALQHRGGFKEVISRNIPINETIDFEVKFRMEITKKNRLVTYLLQIGLENNNPIIKKEILRYKRGQHGSPFHFLDFENGEGYAIINEEDFNKQEEQLDRETQTIDKDVLAIKGLGQFERFKAASAFRQLIENWHVSDFHINSARGSKEAVGDDEHLSITGDNLQRVSHNLFENHPDIFQKIVDTMKHRVPGIDEIDTVLTQDGRLLLNFRDSTFTDPFIDKYVSDGTIKMFAYLVLLYDPRPHPLLCVEEPENQLYPKLLAELAEEFRSYSERGGQVFVSSHSPDFLNATQVDEVFWLVKEEGYSTIQRASEDSQLVSFMAEGDKMGYLWKEGFFKGADPR